MAGISIVTQPGFSGRDSPTGIHVHQIVRILNELTSTELLSLNLPNDHPIREECAVIDIHARSVRPTLGRMLLNFVLNQLRLCLAIYRSDSAAVLFFGTTAYVVPIVAGRLMGKTVFVLPRGHLANSLYLQWRYHHHELTTRFFSWAVGLIERISFRVASDVLVYSPGVAKSLELDETAVYTNAARFVDTEQFDVQTPWQDRDPVVVFVGRFNAEKNVDTLADAVTNLPDGIRARFVGDGPDFETVADAHGDSIELPGWVNHDELPALYNEARLLVMCSEETEGLPTVILEAFACGTPAVAYPVNGVEDVVISGLTGWLLDDREPESIERAILEHINEHHGARVSENCRHVAEQRFSFESAVSRYRVLLERHGVIERVHNRGRVDETAREAAAVE